MSPCLFLKGAGMLQGVARICWRLIASLIAGYATSGKGCPERLSNSHIVGGHVARKASARVAQAGSVHWASEDLQRCLQLCSPKALSSWLV